MPCDNTPIKVCTQINIPQVDNSAIECSDCGYINSNCVILPDAISYLGLPDDTPLNTFVNTLMSSLIDARNRLLIAEGKINTLESHH